MPDMHLPAAYVETELLETSPSEASSGGGAGGRPKGTGKYGPDKVAGAVVMCAQKFARFPTQKQVAEFLGGSVNGLQKALRVRWIALRETYDAAEREALGRKDLDPPERLDLIKVRLMDVVNPP